MKMPPFSEMVRRTAQAVTAAYMECEPPVTLTQFAVLRALHHGGPLYQITITKQTGIDRSTLSAMLYVLRGREYVTCLRAADDGRAKVVTITPAGQRVLAQARNAMAVAERMVMKAVPLTKRVYFREALGAIAESRGD